MNLLLEVFSVFSICILNFLVAQTKRLYALFEPINTSRLAPWIKQNLNSLVVSAPTWIQLILLLPVLYLGWKGIYLVLIGDFIYRQTYISTNMYRLSGDNTYLLNFTFAMLLALVVLNVKVYLILIAIVFTINVFFETSAKSVGTILEKLYEERDPILIQCKLFMLDSKFVYKDQVWYLSYTGYWELPMIVPAQEIDKKLNPRYRMFFRKLKNGVIHTREKK